MDTRFATALISFALLVGCAVNPVNFSTYQNLITVKIFDHQCGHITPALITGKMSDEKFKIGRLTFIFRISGFLFYKPFPERGKSFFSC